MKIISFFVCFLSVTSLSSQSILLLEDTITEIQDSVDLPGEYWTDEMWLMCSNNTSDTLYVNWRREFGEDCPAEWDWVTADANNHHLPDVNESPGPNMLPPNAYFYFNQQIRLYTPGCCDLKIIFSLDGSPNIPIDTGYYHVEINSNGCLLTSTMEEEMEAFKIYPNPSSNFLNLTNTHLLESIEIFDLVGKSCYKSSSIESSQIDISSFQPGVYIARLKTKLNGYFTIRFFKA